MIRYNSYFALQFKISSMDHTFQFESLRQVRSNIKKTLADLSIEQLNKIPEGHNNNLIWHYGHVIVTQQLLCYKLSGVPMHVDNKLVDFYRKGSKPDRLITEEAYQQLQELDAKLVPQFEKDVKDGAFTNFKEYQTSFGITLNSLSDAISFNNVHEGVHLGNMMTMRRLV